MVNSAQAKRFRLNINIVRNSDQRSNTSPREPKYALRLPFSSGTRNISRSDKACAPMDLEEIERQIEALRGEQAAIHYRAQEQMHDIQQKIGWLERQARRITRLNTHGKPAR